MSASSSACRSSPLAARARGPPTITAVALVLLIIGCLAGHAAGSCLSYGHSCWGAHGKRSGRLGLDATDTQWFISRLAPAPTRMRQQLDASQQWFAKPPTDSADSADDQRRLGLAEASLILPSDSEPTEDAAADDRELIIMTQPQRLFNILNHLPSKLEFKARESK